MDIPTFEKQPPFRQTALLTSGSFISYCDDNNVRTSKKELEKLHREGILYPAARVHLGIEEWSRIFAHHQGRDQWIIVMPNAVQEFQPKEIDPRTHYRVSPLWRGSDDWISKWYSDDIDYPAAIPYFAWRDRSHYDFTPDKELVSHDYELLYDKRQFLALKIIRMYEKTHDENEDYREALLKRLHELYRFLALYIDAEVLYLGYKEHRITTFKQFHKQLNNVTEARGEWRSHYRLKEKPRLQKQANKILKKHGMDVKELDSWRFFLSQQSIFNEGSVFRKSPSTYISALDDDTLMKAEDTNKMIFVLNQFLFLVTGEERTVKSIVGHYDDARCIVCHKCFIPKPHKPTQVTCTLKKCIDIQRKDHKKQKAKERREAKQK